MCVSISTNTVFLCVYSDFMQKGKGEINFLKKQMFEYVCLGVYVCVCVMYQYYNLSLSLPGCIADTEASRIKVFYLFSK